MGNVSSKIIASNFSTFTCGLTGLFSFLRRYFLAQLQNVTLPSVSDMPEERSLALRNNKFLNYWKASPFYLEENVMKKVQRTEIEKFSDRSKSNSTLKRDSLAQILQLTSRNFPEELVEGFKGKLRTKRKVQWNPGSGLQKLDFLEKREESLKGQDKDDKEKKEGEEGEDEDEDEDDAQSEELTDDDYYQNEYFDDDEDDYNMEEEGGDEPEY